MANTFWEKDFLIMCSYMSQSADCFMHSGFLLHIISNYALHILCGSPHKICDEEAKLKGSELNRVLRDEDGKIYDVIAGTFLVVGLGEEDFSSLTPEHAKQFKEKFDTPEMFMRLNGKLVMIPMEEERVKAKKPSVLQKLNDMKTLDAPSAVKKPHAKEER